jgi:hypothetical protein
MHQTVLAPRAGLAHVRGGPNGEPLATFDPLTFALNPGGHHCKWIRLAGSSRPCSGARDVASHRGADRCSQSHHVRDDVRDAVLACESDVDDGGQHDRRRFRRRHRQRLLCRPRRRARGCPTERSGTPNLMPYPTPTRLLGIVASGIGLWMVIAAQARMGLPAVRWMSTSVFPGEAFAGALVLLAGLWLSLGCREGTKAVAGC